MASRRLVALSRALLAAGSSHRGFQRRDDRPLPLAYLHERLVDRMPRRPVDLREFRSSAPNAEAIRARMCCSSALLDQSRPRTPRRRSSCRLAACARQGRETRHRPPCPSLREIRAWRRRGGLRLHRQGPWESTTRLHLSSPRMGRPDGPASLQGPRDGDETTQFRRSVSASWSPGPTSARFAHPPLAAVLYWTDHTPSVFQGVNNNHEVTRKWRRKPLEPHKTGSNGAVYSRKGVTNRPPSSAGAFGPRGSLRGDPSPRLRA